MISVIWVYEQKSRKQVTKNILYEKVGGMQDLKAIGGVISKETRSYQKGKCNSPTFLGHVLFVC